jgi:hypothetical protein
MKNTFLFALLLLFSFNLIAQKRTLPKPKPKDNYGYQPFSTKIDPFNPPVIINNNCDIDFVVLPIKVWKVENFIKFEANVRNNGKTNYTLCRGCSHPMITAYTWGIGNKVAEVPISALNSGQNIKISGSFAWPTNNEFLPPINVRVSNTYEFDPVRDCDLTNNHVTLTGEEIKAKIQN